MTLRPEPRTPAPMACRRSFQICRRSGVPQRTAHGLVGRLVRKAMDRGVRLADIPLAEFQEALPSLDESVYGVLGVKQAVAAMQSYGSTAPEQVRRQVERWKERLS